MIQRESHLRCDTPGCESTFGVDDMAMNYSHRHLKESAKRMGWICPSKKDICQDCAEGNGPTQFQTLKDIADRWK